jgi:hypothetical protein
MIPSSKHGAARQIPNHVATTTTSDAGSSSHQTTAIPSLQQPAASRLAGGAPRLPDRADPSSRTIGPPRAFLRGPVPTSRAASISPGTRQLKPSDVGPGDVLFYQRPSSKGPPRPLSFHTAIVRGQEQVASQHAEHFVGGSAKTVHVSVCVEACESGLPKIAEASETRGVGQRALPPGHYIIYRPKDAQEAKESARLMNHWTSGDNVPKYSKTKAVGSVLATKIGKSNPGDMLHDVMAKIQESADSEAPSFPWKGTFCSNIAAAAVLGANRRGITSQSDDDAIELVPDRTVPAGLQAQLAQNPGYQLLGTLDIPLNTPLSRFV